MSRIIIMDAPGGPEVLRRDTRETPRPAADQIVIRVHAFGLNRSDIMVRTGAYPLHRLPASLGFEAAGIVAELGADVTDIAVGDRVSIIPDARAGYTTYGEHAVVPARLVAPIAPDLSFEAASALWGTTLTAYNALIECAALQAGDHVVISAASSGLGLAAVEIARQVNAIPIALTRDKGKTDRLAAAGAAHIFSTADDLPAAVRDVTSGAGARIIFDTVGGPLLAELIRSAATGGIILLNGVLGGTDAMLPVSEVMMRRLTLRGLVLAELMDNQPALARARQFVDRTLTQGAMRPVIAATFPFDRIADAHRFLEANGQVGKVVVTVD